VVVVWGREGADHQKEEKAAPKTYHKQAQAQDAGQAGIESGIDRSELRRREAAWKASRTTTRARIGGGCGSVRCAGCDA
jgi:hypothetical protein